MKFTELELLMSSRGITSLADIARTLNTTPQAVSNWKARDQIPYRVVNEIQNKFIITDDISSDNSIEVNNKSKKYFNPEQTSNNSNSIFDLLLILVNQVKVVLIVPIVIIFFVFLNIYNEEKKKIRTSQNLKVTKRS